MCGIFGILRKKENEKNIIQIIIDGLIQLQNRGYDSAGLCYIDKNTKNINIHKYASLKNKTALDILKEKYYECEIVTNIGIGHNRWATHGVKNDTNAHPHISNDKKICIVHNGIIENYMELKKFLIEKGYTFYSQTDTEIIVNLICYNYNIFKNTYEAIKKSINELQGTYGIIIINRDEPDTIYTVRNGSPILVGVTDDYVIITSEQSGFCNMVNNYITLNNDDICIIKNIENKKLEINTRHEYVNKSITRHIGESYSPFPYKYWIEKEIHEQSQTILNSINMGGRIKNESEVKLGGLENHTEILKTINNIILLGCGTSYHSGLYGMDFMKKICNFDSIQVIDGADFNISDIPKKGNTALILLSQSGETRDLYRCINVSKINNNITIGIVNVVDSLIAREVDCGIYCNAGREISVASTKVFTSQVVCLSLLSIWFSQIHNINEFKRIKMIKDLHNLSNDFNKTIEMVKREVKILSEDYKKYTNMFLLGKNTDEYIAREGSLKIKEISYIHSEAYSISSLKHGPFALLDENFPVIILNTIEENYVKIDSCVEEIYSRLSPIIMITNDFEKINEERKSNLKILNIPKNTTYSSLLANIPLQLLAYNLSTKKKINPDIPKNLAKVVTVD